MIACLPVRIAAAVSASLVLWPLPARADVVLDWNQIALAATVTAGQGPLPQNRTMGIVHLAMHDAVSAITREYDTYLSIGAVSQDAAPEAAAIGAAHNVLTALFPGQAAALGCHRAASLAAEGLTEADPGIEIGEDVAAAILSIAASDGSGSAQFPYTAPGAGNPGVWVPVDARPASAPGWGSVTPWVLRSGSQFRPDPPPALDSERYARDFNEVYLLGEKTNSTRTPDQSDIARFWLGSPAVIWNQVARQLIDARGLDISAGARAHALF